MGILVPMKPSAFRGGEFCLCSVFKANGVGARASALAAFVECHRRIRKGSAPGLEQKIAVVANASPAQVGVAETPDGAVGEVVSAAAVPALAARVGTDLNHTKRRRGGGVGMSVAAGSNKWINMAHRNL